jgi:hypothetical protein
MIFITKMISKLKAKELKLLIQFNSIPMVFQKL